MFLGEEIQFLILLFINNHFSCTIKCASGPSAQSRVNKKTVQKHRLITKKNFKMVVLPVSCQKLLIISAFQSCDVKCVVCLFAYIVWSVSMFCLLVCIKCYHHAWLLSKNGNWNLVTFCHKKDMARLDSFVKDIHLIPKKGICYQLET